MPTKKNHTAKKATTKRSLASSDVALRGIDDKLTIAKEVASKGTDLAVWLIKGIIVVGSIYYVYNRYTNRFVKLKENPNFPLANVTTAQAKNRADAIIGAKTLFAEFEFGSQYQATAQQLAGLNYNGFIRVYNEFGHQTGVLFGGDLNLVEYIKDQFSAYEVQTLSTLLNGAFFKGENPEIEAINQLFNAFPKRV